MKFVKASFYRGSTKVKPEKLSALSSSGIFNTISTSSWSTRESQKNMQVSTKYCIIKAVSSPMLKERIHGTHLIMQLSKRKIKYLWGWIPIHFTWANYLDGTRHFTIKVFCNKKVLYTVLNEVNFKKKSFFITKCRLYSYYAIASFLIMFITTT